MPAFYQQFLLSFSLILSSTGLLARETLFQSGYELAGYGGPEILITELNGQDAMIVGGQGAGLWGNDLYGLSIGVAGYATPGRLELKTSNESFQLGYGGMTLGFSRNPGNLMHWKTDAFLGAGQVWITDNSTSFEVAKGNILVLELSAGADINLTNHLQMGISSSWRIISNPQVRDLTGKALSGLGVKLSFEFGRFE